MLLEKALGGGNRALVRVSDDALLSQLDTALWTLKPDSFLPHGQAGEGDGASEPILLTADPENLNKANFLFLMAGAEAGALDYYERVFILFNGDSEGELKAARDQWKGFLSDGLKPTYWTQSESGKWQKKAL